MNNDELQWRAVEEVRGQLCDQMEVVQIRVWEQSAKQVNSIVQEQVRYQLIKSYQFDLYTKIMGSLRAPL